MSLSNILFLNFLLLASSFKLLNLNEDLFFLSLYSLIAFQNLVLMLCLPFEEEKDPELLSVEIVEPSDFLRKLGIFKQMKKFLPKEIIFLHLNI